MDPAESLGGIPRQGILLAAAMFVFVIDTPFMNVSTSAVVHDLDTTVSGVQSAVAIEALVSAAPSYPWPTSSTSAMCSRTTRRMSDAQLEELLAGQPEAIQDEILSINTDARDLALQVALLVALLASLVGVVNAFTGCGLDPALGGRRRHGARLTHGSRGARFAR